MGAGVAAAALVVAGVVVLPQVFGNPGSSGSSGAAEALPESTFAYAGVDISDDQLRDALQVAKRFPALAGPLSVVDEDQDDLRATVFELISRESGEDCGLTWEDDFGWVGDSAAMAGVDLDGDQVPVAVIASNDADQAEATVTAIAECTGDDSARWLSTDGWLLLGEDGGQLEEIADAAEQGTLADSGNFQERTGDLDELGAMTMYASPAAAGIVTDSLPSLLGMTGGFGGLSPDPSDLGSQPDDPFAQFCPGLSDPAAMAEYSESQADAFDGAALTLRIADDGVELQAVTDNGVEPMTGTSAGSLVGSLPEDTVAAFGLSLQEGWTDRTLTSLAAVCGEDFDADAMMSGLSDLTGLDLPTDLETLTGDAMAVSVGDDLSAMGGPEQQPVALTIQGDAEGIAQVVDKVNSAIENVGGDAEGFLDHDSEGDKVVIGPNPSYRDEVLGGGGLESQETFRSVVEHADDAGAVLYVDLDAVGELARPFLGEDEAGTLDALQGFGMSSWADGTTSHALLRLGFDE